MAWLTGWSNRKSQVVNSQSGAGAGYPKGIKVYYGSGTDQDEEVYGVNFRAIYCNSKCKTDFGDIRFTDNDEETELDYWLMEKVDSSYALFWVEVADNLDSSSATIYIYYGNAGATTTSDGEETFLEFDDHNDNSLDWSKWDSNSKSDYSETGEKLVMANITDANNYIYTQASFSNFCVECKMRQSHTQGQTYLCPTPSAGVYDSDEQTHLRFNNNKVHIRIGSVNSDTSVTEDLDNYWRHTLKIPSSGTAYGEIRNPDESLAHSYSNTPDNTTNYIGFLCFNNASAVGYLDWMYVRKWVNPEPTFGATGSEESLGGAKMRPMNAGSSVGVHIE